MASLARGQGIKLSFALCESARICAVAEETCSLNCRYSPQGTANALYHSLFPPESVSASTESLLDPFRSLTAFLRQSSRLCPLNIALNTLHRSSDLVRQVLTTVVTSTALHASLLSDAEALRATVPGLERFKIAAMQNVSNWNDGRLVLNGDVQIYTTENKGFTGLQDDTVIDGPFLYLVTALVDRFEPTFIVAPYQAPSGSNRKLAPQHPVIDVIAIRPLRHSTTSDLYTAAQKEQDRKQIRQDYAKNLGPATGGMYGGGTHVDLKYDDAPTVSIVEYYRCKQITWEPVRDQPSSSAMVADIHLMLSRLLRRSSRRDWSAWMVLSKIWDAVASLRAKCSAPRLLAS